MTDPDITRRLDLLEQLLRDLPDRLDEKYVDRREYAADQRADSIQLGGLEHEVRTLRLEVDSLERDLTGEREKRETSMKLERERRDGESATNRRLVYSSFLFPIAVAVVLAILLGGVLQ